MTALHRKEMWRERKRQILVTRIRRWNRIRVGSDGTDVVELMSNQESAATLFDPPCICCGVPALWLCDALIGFIGHYYEELKPELVGQYLPRRAILLIGPEMDGHTCDAPLCDACTKKIGPVFDIPEPGANFEDRCPVHRDLGAFEGRCRPLRAEDIERAREDAHAMASRLSLASLAGGGPNADLRGYRRKPTRAQRLARKGRYET